MTDGKLPETIQDHHHIEITEETRAPRHGAEAPHQEMSIVMGRDEIETSMFHADGLIDMTTENVGVRGPLIDLQHRRDEEIPPLHHLHESVDKQAEATVRGKKAQVLHVIAHIQVHVHVRGRGLDHHLPGLHDEG